MTSESGPQGPEGSGIWASTLSAIASQTDPAVFNTYFAPISRIHESVERVELAIPNRFHRDWVVNSYQDFIEKVVRQVTGFETDVVIAVGSGPIGPLPKQEPDSVHRDQDGRPEQSFLQRSSKTSSSTLPSRRSRRNRDKYTFDNFVSGDCNQLAVASSKAVAEKPGRAYNPLFLFAPSGLGKTHLLKAICAYLSDHYPELRTMILSAEDFTNHVIAGIRDNRMDELRRVFREECDVLLIDDVQFLGGKGKTQEEFFHTFNSLHDTGCQIVLTADKYPHEISGLEERLASRFQWGLIADILPPDLETRVAILEKKARLNGIDLPQDVAMYLARHVKRNVRELEGSLVRVAAMASCQGGVPTIDIARQALRHQVPESSPPDFDRILRIVCSHYNVKLNDVCSHRRHKAIVIPRQVAMYIARELTNLSYPDLGTRFGGRDHTTVLSAYRKISRLIDTDPSVRASVEQITRSLTVLDSSN